MISADIIRLAMPVAFSVSTMSAWYFVWIFATSPIPTISDASSFIIFNTAGIDELIVIESLMNSSIAVSMFVMALLLMLSDSDIVALLVEPDIAAMLEMNVSLINAESVCFGRP